MDRLTRRYVELTLPGNPLRKFGNLAREPEKLEKGD